MIIVGPDRSSLKIDLPGIEVLGRIEDRRIIKTLYEEASIFVMPSLCEPFGLVFLEAMGYRLPCIGSTIDAMPEIIQEGKTGFLVPPGDADSLSERICSLLKDRELAEKMGSEGYKRLKEKFRWDIVGEKIDAHLDNILISP